MKNIKITIVAILASFSLSSCDNSLDTLLSTSIEIDQTIADVESLNIVVNGAYSRFATSNFYNQNIIVIPALLSDNCSFDPLDNRGRFMEYDNYTVNQNDIRASSLWDNLYRAIAQTSIIIREAAKLDVPESQLEDANHYIGESHALRALSFLLVQQLYAQPYNFTSDAGHLGAMMPDFDLIGIDILYPSRISTAEVYAQIVEDLQMAISLMGERSSPFRFDRSAAKALLARTYLHMENWSGAATLASEVIDEFGGRLTETDDYIDGWDVGESSESIFALANTALDNSGNNAASFFFLGDFEAFATPDFINTFSETDVRLDLYPFDSGLGHHLIAKYPNPRTGTDNIQVIRLSEVYLIKAEAHARMNQPIDAQNALNEVVETRDGDASGVTATGQALIDRIILERRKELAFEGGFRLHDLTRTGTTFTKFRIGQADLIIEAPTNFTILPIPIDEINANPSLQGQQNPGY